MPRSYFGSAMAALTLGLSPRLSQAILCDRSLNALIWINSPCIRELRSYACDVFEPANEVGLNSKHELKILCLTQLL